MRGASTESQGEIEIPMGTASGAKRAGSSQCCVGRNCSFMPMLSPSLIRKDTYVLVSSGVSGWSSQGGNSGVAGNDECTLRFVESALGIRYLPECEISPTPHSSPGATAWPLYS